MRIVVKPRNGLLHGNRRVEGDGSAEILLEGQENWEKADPIRGRNPDTRRRDEEGNVIRHGSYGRPDWGDLPARLKLRRRAA
jgi:hypothetical protein